MNEHQIQPTGHNPDLASKVLDRIEMEQVVPLPKWKFTVKDRLFWVFWVLSIILGSLVAGALLFAFVNAGWEYRIVTHQHLFGFVMQVLPTVWIVAVVGAMLMAYENFRHTSRGYRVPLLAVIGFSLLGIMLGGLFFYASGAGKLVEEQVGSRIPLYRPVNVRERSVWSQPGQGLLGGEVLDIDNEAQSFRLRGFDGSIYVMGLSDLASDSQELLMERNVVRVIGIFAKDGDGPEKPFFRPCYIFPWDSRVGGVSKRGGVACGDERTVEKSRSTDCKDSVPYEILKTLRRGACR